MTKIINKIKQHFKKPTVAPIIILAILTLLVGTFFYRAVEGFAWLDSFYFCVMMLTTIGYGNMDLATITGKLFTIFYAIFGVVIIASAANYLVHQALAHHLKSNLGKKRSKDD